MITEEQIKRACLLPPGTVMLERPTCEPRPEDPFRIFAHVGHVTGDRYRVTLTPARPGTGMIR